MSSELCLIAPGSSQRKLRIIDKFLKERGYERSYNFLFMKKGVRYYFWFDYNDFRSHEGVELDVRTTENNDIYIHARSRSMASYYDISELNEVIRQLRRMFGGYIEGDYGRNRYIPLWDDKSTPISRGIGVLYDKVSDNINSIGWSLPKEEMADDIKKKQKEKGSKLDRNDISFTELVCSMDPSRVLYNELMPFLVACLESFLKQAFIILLRHDIEARKKLREKGKREINISFDELCQVEEKYILPEEIIAKRYNFQNLKSIKEAYLEYFDIDIEGILRKSVVRKNRPRISLYEKLNELIEYRHRIIHELDINRQLTRKKFQDYMHITTKSLKEITKAIEKKYNIKIVKLNP